MSWKIKSCNIYFVSVVSEVPTWRQHLFWNREIYVFTRALESYNLPFVFFFFMLLSYLSAITTIVYLSSYFWCFLKNREKLVNKNFYHFMLKSIVTAANIKGDLSIAHFQCKRENLAEKIKCNVCVIRWFISQSYIQ